MKISFDWLKGISGWGGKFVHLLGSPFQKIGKLFSKIRFMKIRQIRYRLIGLFIIVAVVPIIITSAISNNGYRDAMLKKINTFSAQEVSQAGNNLELKFTGYENTIMKDLNTALLEHSNAKEKEARESIEDSFRKYLLMDKSIKAFYFYGMIDKKNVEIMSGATQGLTIEQLRNSAVYRETNRVNSLYWDSTAAITDGGKDLILGKTLDNGASLFVVIGEENICDLINPNYSPVDDGSYYILMDGKGKILVSPEQMTLGQNILNIVKDTPHLREMIKDRSSSNNDIAKINNKEALVIFHKLANHNWYLLNIKPTATLFKEVNDIGLMTTLIGLVFIGIAIFISIYVSNQISNSVETLADAMKQAENGDLTTRVDITSHDEFEYLGENFNQMFNQISQLVNEVQAAVNQTMEQSTTLEDNSNLSVKNTENVANAMGDISKGTMDQINEVEQASLSMGELANDIGAVVSKAADVEIITDKTKDLSFRSKEAIINLINKAKGSAEITNAVVKDIEDLNASAVEIGNITEIIADIAEKTNLLALNAAIEAARAGEAGRGFAVVAKEVNKLAVQSQTAAQAIEDLLQVVKTKTNSSAKNIDRAHVIVDEQADAVQMAEDAFEAIIHSMDDVIDRMTEMSVFVQKVDAFKDQTMQSILSISSVSEETAAAAEEVTAASEEQTSIANQIQHSIGELRATAEHLVALIAKFKVA